MQANIREQQWHQWRQAAEKGAHFQPHIPLLSITSFVTQSDPDSHPFQSNCLLIDSIVVLPFQYRSTN